MEVPTLFFVYVYTLIEAHISFYGRVHEKQEFVQPCRLQNSGQKNVDYTAVVFTVSGFGRTDDLWNGGAASEVLRWVHLRGITNEECRWWYNNSPTIQDQTICAEYYNDTAQSSCQRQLPAALPPPPPQHVHGVRVQRAHGAAARHAVTNSLTDLGLHDMKISTGNDSFTDHGFHDKHIKVEGFIWGVATKGDSGGPLTFVDTDGRPTMVGIVSFGSSAGCNSPFPSAYVRPGHYHDWFYEVSGINFDWSSDDLESFKPIQLPIDVKV
ncbi:hypothetical protein MSG28_005498 [Choristoneura fumiferana]|uniref:Uncharacterized protein n=1 Tax=Choristoneura fumiferana TaxID=7141 RepID=A0ACC0L063_CHOFU|nr:hypothetical protein MSG28_005498 [Choristoneura fumiferana]